MSYGEYRHEIEETVESASSFFEAERILEKNDYSFSLVGNDKRTVNDEEIEVFIYELHDSRRQGFYLFGEDDIGAKVLENDRSEPLI